MNIDTFFPGSHIAAADLAGQEVPVVISNCVAEQLGDDNKAVLYFQGRTKGLVLNKTNAGTISDVFGSETDTWPGQQIILFPSMTDFKGKIVACVRVRVVDLAQSVVVAPQPVAVVQPAQQPVQTQPSTPQF